jgi:hypothetical protein
MIKLSFPKFPGNLKGWKIQWGQFGFNILWQNGGDGLFQIFLSQRISSVGVIKEF